MQTKPPEKGSRTRFHRRLLLKERKQERNVVKVDAVAETELFYDIPDRWTESW